MQRPLTPLTAVCRRRRYTTLSRSQTYFGRRMRLFLRARFRRRGGRCRLPAAPYGRQFASEYYINETTEDVISHSFNR